MSFKGYPSSRKIDGSPVEHVTVEPIRTEQNGLSAMVHQFMRSVGTDAAENDSVLGVIEATAHAALKGDMVNVTSGAFSGYESKVTKVEANLIYLADALTLGTGDTFEILRHKAPTVDATGNINTTSVQGPTQFVLDGVDTEVERDTAVPANSIPLPIITLDNVGVPVDFATQATLAAVLAKIIAAPATEAKQDTIITALGTLNAKDFATQTTLAAVLAKIIAAPATEAKQDTLITGLGSLLTELQLKADLTETQPVSAASLPLPTGASTSALQTSLLTELQLKADLTETQPVSVASLPLPTGAATETTLASLLTELQLKADLTETQPVSLASVPLPTGAATSALQTTGNTSLGNIDTKLPATVGQKAMAASLAVVLASDQSSVPVAATQAGTWSVRAQDGSGNALSSEAAGSARALHTHAKGADIADSARKATGTVTSGAWVELIAATAAECQGLCVFDSSGFSLELGVGAAAAEVRKLIIPPGGLNGFIPLRIAAGSRISIRALGTTADYTSAEHLLTLLQ